MFIASFAMLAANKCVLVSFLIVLLPLWSSVKLKTFMISSWEFRLSYYLLSLSFWLKYTVKLQINTQKSNNGIQLVHTLLMPLFCTFIPSVRFALQVDGQPCKVNWNSYEQEWNCLILVGIVSAFGHTCVSPVCV